VLTTNLCRTARYREAADADKLTVITESTALPFWCITGALMGATAFLAQPPPISRTKQIKAIVLRNMEAHPRDANLRISIP
jgi:hypothetical protein